MDSDKQKKVIISVVAVVVVVVLAIALFNLGPATGKAYRSVESSLRTAAETGQSIYFQYGQGYAAENDAVTIPVFISNTLSTGQERLTQAELCLDFDRVGTTHRFVVTGVDITLAGWSWLGRTNAQIVGRLNDDECVDVIADQNAGATAGTQQLGTITFSVDHRFVSEQDSMGTATDLTDAVRTITLSTPLLSGLLAQSGTYQVTDALPSATEIVIVPACPDSDNDGYANAGLVQEDWDNSLTDDSSSSSSASEGYDLRACAKTNVVDGAVDRLDCADGSPDGTEICDGKDNDCNGLIDDGLSAPPNEPPVGQTVLSGECVGTKICRGASGWENQYGDKYGSEICDEVDNDCNGQVNDGLNTCGLRQEATRVVLAQPMGNVFIEYSSNGQFGVQQFTSKDLLLTKLLYDSSNQNCGNNNQQCCQTVFDAGQDFCYCKDNTYAIAENNAVYWASPTQNRLRIATTENIGKALGLTTTIPSIAAVLNTDGVVTTDAVPAMTVPRDGTMTDLRQANKLPCGMAPDLCRGVTCSDACVGTTRKSAGRCSEGICSYTETPNSNLCPPEENQ